MHKARTVAVVLLLALAPAGAGLAAPPVKPFEDASDDRSDPTEVQQTGTYEGDLFPPGDEDWYQLVPSAAPSSGRPTCVEVAFAGDAHAQANMTAPQDEAYHAEANLTPDETVSMGLATKGFDGATFGLHPFEGLWSLGPYEFTVRTEHIDGANPEQDDLEGKDAADEGPCLQQSLPKGGERTIAFHAGQGDRLTLSLATPSGQPVSITLEDPFGEERGEIGTPSPGVPVLHERIDTSGTWTLSATNGMETSNTVFLVGLSLAEDCQAFCSLQFADDECDDEDDEDECDDEDARPCQPNCMWS